MNPLRFIELAPVTSLLIYLFIIAPTIMCLGILLIGMDMNPDLSESIYWIANFILYNILFLITIVPAATLNTNIFNNINHCT